ncbi:DoxX family protein [Streptomyces sp. G3]|uniref:DoxX family protein n=1 Tax=unclassified Streptomyces TaxID=2593676 RepID=UPI0015E07C62|nr:MULTISPECIES: DoxX family protein [unclassified Streptomyces]MCM1937929.1 DoxX family protein [Streptomyces sp. G3]WKX19169.1 DoxX family protein [Streptomyces sp. HUAS CX7]
MTHGMRTDVHISPESGGRGDWRDNAARYALLPLRIFLGVTFIYAGLDKLTDGAFMKDSGAGSVGDMMRAVRDSSAVPALIDLALKSPAGFGYAIALGELAVGIGALLGLLTRLAALGGALISLSLWLTVSWAADPYYYGNDLPYLMAWLPLVLAGAPLLSLDAVLRSRRRGRTGGGFR